MGTSPDIVLDEALVGRGGCGSAVRGGCGGVIGTGFDAMFNEALLGRGGFAAAGVGYLTRSTVKEPSFMPNASWEPSLLKATLRTASSMLQRAIKA